MKRRKKIEQFVKLSLTNGKLDPRKITFIAKALTKKELSLFVKLLRLRRREEKVVVTTAIEAPRPFVKRLRRIFIDKDTSFSEDPAIIAGMKVSFSDFVFDASIKGYLEKALDEYGSN